MTTAVATRSLRFDPEEHRYWLDDREIPSVSSILSPITSPLYSRMPEWRREETALRGTYAHKATELYDLDRLNWETLDPKLEPYVNAWLAFRYASDVEILEIEQRVAHPILWYAGTFDRVAILNGQLTVLEIKTTAGSPEAWWGLQTAAYQQAYNLDKPKADQARRRVSVQLRPDETYVLTEWSDPHDVSVFNAFLSTRHYMTTHGYGDTK